MSASAHNLTYHGSGANNRGGDVSGELVNGKLNDVLKEVTKDAYYNGETQIALIYIKNSNSVFNYDDISVAVLNQVADPNLHVSIGLSTSLNSTPTAELPKCGDDPTGVKFAQEIHVGQLKPTEYAGIWVRLEVSKSSKVEPATHSLDLISSYEVSE